ncbi:hypothetical protein ACFC4G_47500 [Streptomyces sp. NPDC056002]|uniref:hypothetical protein n=1 Tax=Streptomyces sp. NPDC056002 TaxID=3345675 RepID=UPI0035D578EC
MLGALGHNSWEAYCSAEFGISRAQAYRLFDVSRSLAAIHDAVTAGPACLARETPNPGTQAALDYGLSQRALIDISSRTDAVTELITRRLATLARNGLQALDEPAVRAVVRQTVRDVRNAPAARRSADGPDRRRAARRRRRPRRHQPRDRRAHAGSRPRAPDRNPPHADARSQRPGPRPRSL